MGLDRRGGQGKLGKKWGTSPENLRRKKKKEKKKKNIRFGLEGRDLSLKKKREKSA